MNKGRYEWKVGLFVLVGLVLLAALLLQFSKGTTFFRPTYRILLRAPNVGGLKMRSQVLMAGVPIGTVADVQLAPSGRNVIITLRIFSQFKVHKDARFVIEQSGFLGDQYVAILPTQNLGSTYRDSDMAEAEAPFNLQEVARSAAGFIQRVDETAKMLNDAIGDVRRFVLNEQTLTNLSAAVGNLRSASERALGTLDNFDALVASNSPALSSSGSNLVAFSEQMNHFANGLSGVLATNSDQIHTAVKNIESSTEVLKNVLDELQAGKGLAGTLLKNEQLAVSVEQIANNLSITSSNLNRLGLWGILWQHKPPRTNAPGSEANRVLSAPKDPFE
jgi:phospholipid/cholesterol/gamma-HCH transport system substrate-binding protein